MLTKKSCDICTEFKVSIGKETPCATCVVDLMQVNREAFKVFSMTQNQLIVSAWGDIIDIDFVAVKMAMDVLRVADQKECWEKVKKIFNIYKDKLKGVEKDNLANGKGDAKSLTGVGDE